MKRIALPLVFVLGALGAGCGAQFELTLPERFLVLRNDYAGQGAGYARRATTPDGVVVAVKVVDPETDNRSLATLAEAATLHLREQRGYALVSEEDVQAASGQRGRLLRFGRDMGGHAYRYTLALFLSGGTLWLVEAGGRDAPYAALEAEIERAIAAMRF